MALFTLVLLKYNVSMTTIHEIENAVEQLPDNQLREFREWFESFDAEVWDREFEQDAAGDKLGRLAQRALDALEQGGCTEL